MTRRVQARFPKLAVQPDHTLLYTDTIPCTQGDAQGWVPWKPSSSSTTAPQVHCRTGRDPGLTVSAKQLPHSAEEQPPHAQSVSLESGTTSASQHPWQLTPVGSSLQQFLKWLLNCEHTVFFRKSIQPCRKFSWAMPTLPGPQLCAHNTNPQLANQCLYGVLPARKHLCLFCLLS